MKNEIMKKILLICLIFGIGFCFLISSAFAQKSCYTDQELQKVREWEKQWSGKVINGTNVDSVKDLLPSSAWTDVLLKDQEHYGDVSLKITPYQRFEFKPEAYREQTKSYIGKCKVGPQGELVGYDFEKGGLPFLDPQTGPEVMWNFNKRYDGDDFSDPGAFTNYLVNRDKRERVQKWSWGKVFFVGRCTIPPTPSLPNPRGLHYVEYSSVTSPADLTGLGLITMRYIDTTKDDDGWLYIPTMRRFRRISTAQRSDSAGGADWTWDDYDGHSGRIGSSNYKLIGRRELLVSRRVISANIKRDKTQLYWQTTPREVERVNTYVIEIVSKDPDYGYSKKIGYVDPESFKMPYCEMYDKKGRLWKIGEYNQVLSPKYGVELNWVGGIIDLQRIHASCFWAGDLEANRGDKEEVADLGTWKTKLH